MSERSKSAKDVRHEKLEAALKENLRRRKAQARARKSGLDHSDSENAAKETPSSPPSAKLRD